MEREVDLDLARGSAVVRDGVFRVAAIGIAGRKHLARGALARNSNDFCSCYVRVRPSVEGRYVSVLIGGVLPDNVFRLAKRSALLCGNNTRR